MTQDQSASRNSGVYRWIEEACQAMRQNLNGARSYEERQATADKMLELLSGVPCPPEDLGFDSPADRAAVSERPLKMAYATPEAYAAVNPLGGPAVIFEAMAKRIRAGEDFYDVLDDYGLQSKFDERSER